MDLHCTLIIDLLVRRRGKPERVGLAGAAIDELVLRSATPEAAGSILGSLARAYGGCPLRAAALVLASTAPQRPAAATAPTQR
ncbi:hypothetical protein [Amycolatopsis sp. NPDC004625]|uniref:hypothetical protein n=1 Tax=Amycolatopsis sp. NPDC004625 TaxID=3154670 RepID=UPI0033AD799D